MLTNHWYWRDGWGVGTRYLAWHLLWEDESALHRHAAHYREALLPFGEAFAIVPDEGLHLTMQGVGHSADVPRAAVQDAVAAAERQLAAVTMPTVVFADPRPHRETVGWTVHPPDGVSAVRAALRDALVEVFGAGNLEPEYNPGRPFVPHVTLAYATCDVPSEPVAAALDAVSAEPVTVTARQASLIELHRDRRQYEWEVVARAPIGNDAG